jgi:hypothetical protein
MDAAVSALHHASQSSLPAGVVGFVDDIYVYISDRCMIEAATACTDLIRANRMLPKPASCAVLVQQVRLGAWTGGRADALGFAPTESGFMLLGAPIGSPAYRLEASTSQIQSMTQSLPAIQHLHPQSGYILLKS